MPVPNENGPPTNVSGPSGVKICSRSNALPRSADFNQKWRICGVGTWVLVDGTFLKLPLRNSGWLHVQRKNSPARTGALSAAAAVTLQRFVHWALACRIGTQPADSPWFAEDRSMTIQTYGAGDLVRFQACTLEAAEVDYASGIVLGMKRR
jgi:hypothetical protein